MLANRAHLLWLKLLIKSGLQTVSITSLFNRYIIRLMIWRTFLETPIVKKNRIHLKLSDDSILDVFK